MDECISFIWKRRIDGGYFSADTLETMAEWLRVFGEYCDMGLKKKMSIAECQTVRIEAKKPEGFEGYSVWLELPGLTKIMNAIEEKTGIKQTHIPHISLIYGIDET
eukprot:UN15877